jgi:hypothetical protein
VQQCGVDAASVLPTCDATVPTDQVHRIANASCPQLVAQAGVATAADPATTPGTPGASVAIDAPQPPSGSVVVTTDGNQGVVAGPLSALVTQTLAPPLANNRIFSADPASLQTLVQGALRQLPGGLDGLIAAGLRGVTLPTGQQLSLSSLAR